MATLISTQGGKLTLTPLDDAKLDEVPEDRRLVEPTPTAPSEAAPKAKGKAEKGKAGA